METQKQLDVSENSIETNVLLDENSALNNISEEVVDFKISDEASSPSNKEKEAEVLMDTTESSVILENVTNNTTNLLPSDDEENDINVLNIKRTKTRQILDSDSENDEFNALNSLPEKCIRKTNGNSSDKIDDEFNDFEANNEQLNELAEVDKLNKSTKNNEQNGDYSNEDGQNAGTKSKKLKRIAIIDSESEDETPITPHNKSFNEDLDLPNVYENAPIYKLNEKGQLVAESNEKTLQEQKSRFAALCDAESSEDEREYNAVHEDSPSSLKKSSKTSRKSNSKASKIKPEKKMTAKEALLQRQEIRSESQRMLRESRTSLPYHKPKVRSIKEFLQNRPRLSLTLSNTGNTPPSLAMKMSTEQLEIVTKKLEERKKEVSKFYKSESESEEEILNKEDNVLNGEENNKENELTVANNEDAIKESTTSCIDSDSNENELSTNDIEIQNKEGIIESVPEHIESDVTPTVAVPVQTGSDNVNKTTALVTNIEALNTNVENESDLADNAMDVSLQQTEELSSSEPKIQQICDDQKQSPTIINEISPKEGSNNSPTNTENQEKITNQTEQNSSTLETSNNSEEYDFNLDGIEDITENNTEVTEKNKDDIEEEHLQRLLKKYEVDSPQNNDLEKPTGKRFKLDLLKNQLGAIKPCLSGGPNQEIDLDEGTTKPSGVAQLMERFMQHARRKNVVKGKIKLDIVNLSQGEVRKETVSVSVEPEEEPVVILEKPGIKLQKLRNELQSQMAQRRSELWQQKQQSLNVDENKEKDDGEKSNCGADEDLLDDEEEAELTEGETTDDEDYDEEDYNMEKLEKPRIQSAFIDNEAEESDADENDEILQADDFEEKSEDEDDAMDTDINILNEGTSKKPLKRILKGFTEDSDEEESSQLVSESPAAKQANTSNRNTSSASTDTWEDDEPLPPNQPRQDETPRKEMTQSKSRLGFLTPVMHLTGLQGLNSGSKFLHESPVSPFSFPPDPSPSREQNLNSALQKKLFSDSCDTLDSETNMEDLAQLCSGKFPSSTMENLPPNSQVNMEEIAQLCSGRFSDSTEKNQSNNETSKATTQDLLSICSGSFIGITVDKSSTKESEKGIESPFDTDTNNTEENDTSKRPSTNELIRINVDHHIEEIKDLDEDKLISQLLDEEEMEQFKKKFDSPVVINSNNLNVADFEQEVQGGGVLYDSSDDEADESKQKKFAKKLNKKLTFSDDESASEPDNDMDDEKINLHDDFSDEDIQNKDGTNANKIVDYDSEENEVVYDDEEALQQKKLKPSDFFENEAELSESDWDSADEDEKGLDALETEQGDADVFDENKMRSDLEKIHMRRVLDQDNQEIKILQELLLEDGELHGTGRQRQFRWRNIDEAGNEETNANDGEAEAYLDEEESEEQWRRARYQREMFLKSQQEKQIVIEEDDLIEQDSDSQVMKMGQEAIRKSLSAVITSTSKESGPTTPEVKKPLMLLNTRGSFLSRNDRFLTRLVELTASTNPAPAGGAKNSRKFVFQTVDNNSTKSMSETSLDNKKRKAADGTPSIIKKLRLASDTSPVVKNVNSKKQLFK